MHDTNTECIITCLVPTGTGPIQSLGVFKMICTYYHTLLFGLYYFFNLCIVLLFNPNTFVNNTITHSKWSGNTFNLCMRWIVTIISLRLLLHITNTIIYFMPFGRNYIKRQINADEQSPFAFSTVTKHDNTLENPTAIIIMTPNE
eukprot:456111_1